MSEPIQNVITAQVRQAAGRADAPSAVCIDSQAVQTTDVGGQQRGDDGSK